MWYLNRDTQYQFCDIVNLRFTNAERLTFPWSAALLKDLFMPPFIWITSNCLNYQTKGRWGCILVPFVSNRCCLRSFLLSCLRQWELYKYLNNTFALQNTMYHPCGISKSNFMNPVWVASIVELSRVLTVNHYDPSPVWVRGPHTCDSDHICESGKFFCLPICHVIYLWYSVMPGCFRSKWVQ